MMNPSAIANVDNAAMDDNVGDWGEFLSKSVAALNIKNESPMMLQSLKQPSSPWSSTIITMPHVSTQEHEEYLPTEERLQKNEMTQYPMPPKLQRCESNAQAHSPDNKEYAIDGHQLSSFLTDNESPHMTNVSFFGGSTFSSSLYERIPTKDSPVCQSKPPKHVSTASPASTASIQTPSTINFSSWSPCLDIDAHASPYGTALSTSSSNACTPNMAHYTTLVSSPMHPSTSLPFSTYKNSVTPKCSQSPMPSDQEQRFSAKTNHFNDGFVHQNKNDIAPTSRLRSASVISEFSPSPFQLCNTSTTASSSPAMDRMRHRAASEVAIGQQSQSSYQDRPISPSPFQIYNTSTTASASPTMDRMRHRAASTAAVGQQSQLSYQDRSMAKTAEIEAGKCANGANNLNMGAETALYYEIEFKRFRKDVYIGAANFRIGDYVKVEADRGHDLGVVVGVSTDLTRLHMEMKAQGVQGIDKRLNEPLKLIQGLASPFDMNLLRRKSIEEYGALEICKTKVDQRNLPMEVIDAEFQFDHHKLTFYFKADRRIDFRELVRDLFAMYKTRIWMQQIPEDPIERQSSNIL